MAIKKKAVRKAAKKAAPRKKAVKSKKADLKTKPTAVSVEAFIAKVPNEQRRNDAKTALALMKKATGMEPKMWGPSIIGFGSYHYKYESGREGEMCITGFSPRSTALVFYVMGGVSASDATFRSLGKHKMSKSCLYINKLADIDLKILEAAIRKSVAYVKKAYPTTA